MVLLRQRVAPEGCEAGRYHDQCAFWRRAEGCSAKPVTTNTSPPSTWRLLGAITGLLWCPGLTPSLWAGSQHQCTPLHLDVHYSPLLCGDRWNSTKLNLTLPSWCEIWSKVVSFVVSQPNALFPSLIAGPLLTTPCTPPKGQHLPGGASVLQQQLTVTSGSSNLGAAGSVHPGWGEGLPPCLFYLSHWVASTPLLATLFLSTECKWLGCAKYRCHMWDFWKPSEGRDEAPGDLGSCGRNQAVWRWPGRPGQERAVAGGVRWMLMVLLWDALGTQQPTMSPELQGGWLSGNCTI
jgi:hypothetical protein